MRVASAFLIAVILTLAHGALAQTAPAASPSAGSSFSASGTGGIDFELTLAPGGTLANADIDLDDADNPGGGQTLSVNSVTPNPGTPTGVTAPTAQSGTAGNTLTISWTGTAAATNAPGNYDFTVNFQDDEGAPNVVNAVIRIIITDVAPAGAQGADAISGTGSGGSPFAPTGQSIGSTLSLDLADVTDGNTGQTLIVASVTPGGGNPSGAITVTNNAPGAGGTLTLTATAASALTISDVGQFDFAVTVSDQGANTNVVINLRVVVNAPAVTVTSTGSPDEQGTVTGTYTVTCTPAPGANLTVSIQMSGTAAVASGTDYNLSSTQTLTYTTGPTGTIVVPAAGTATITLTPVDDAAIEGAETATLAIQSGAGYTVGAPASANLSIADNDSITMTAGTTGSPAEPATNGTFTITASQNVPSATTINFTVTGTATFSGGTPDYTLSSGAANFTFSTTTGVGSLDMATGTNSVSITVTVNNDALAEGSETVILDINAGAGYTLGAPSQATHNIADDDSISVSIAATGTPNETGPAAATYTFTASANVPSNTTINFQMSGTAATTGDYNLSSGGTLSYTAPNGTIVMASGTNTISITLTPIDDAAIEGSETAIMTIQAGAGYTLGAPASASRTITDNDAAPAAVTMSAAGNPGDANVAPGATKSALGFRLAETGGGSDFTVTSVSVDINVTNNTGGVAVAAISSVQLRRGGVLQTITNGGAGWSVAGNLVTVNFTGLSSVVTAGGTGDYTVSISFSGTAVPSPNPRYSASITPADINGGTSVSGSAVTGGTLTLVEELPDDPLDEDKKDDSCNLATQGGPAWPLAAFGVLFGVIAIRRRKTVVQHK